MPASSFPGPSPVKEILVTEGQMVTNGQVLATLENHERLDTAWRAALAQTKVAERRLAQVRAGVKPSEIAAQRAEIARLKADLGAARISNERNQNLRRLEAISKSELERAQLSFETAQRLLEAAEQKLHSLEEISDVDTARAVAELEAAKAEADHSNSEVRQSLIISPIDGQVLKLNCRPGETATSKGIATVGKTNRIVIAEVYETDAPRLKLGAPAEVSGVALPGKLSGKLSKIGWQIQPNRLFSQDPAAANDARVVEVEIQLDEPAKVERLVNARVYVVMRNE
ncbi:MAG: aaeA [Verrucomicrobiales bacterium]|nr:aaeA [Verrucomicrobiales bacterium]